MALIPIYSQVQFGCGGDIPPPTIGPAECPECPTDPAIVVLCCPTPGNALCVLDCNNPILIKACGGIPPYSFYSDDDSFIKVTQVDTDTALVEIVKAYFQYSYSLRYHAWVSNPCNGASAHPGANITEVYIKQVNKVYNCNMELIPGDDFHDPNMVFDSDPDCDPACFILGGACGELADQAIPFTGSGAQIANIRTDTNAFGRVHSPLGLDIPYIIQGSKTWDTTEIIDTGVIGAIPRDPIAVYVYDSVAAFAYLEF